MIEINLLENAKSGRKPGKIFYAVAAVAVLAVASGFHLKFGDDPQPRVGKSDINKKTSFSSSSPARKSADKERKKKISRKFKVKGFINLMGKNLAMLVSGREVLWVEKGQNAFGVKIEDIEEKGVFTKTRSGGGGREFFPLK